MPYVPVVTFETDHKVSALIDDVLRWHGIEHVSYAVARRQAALLSVQYFRDILERHHPRVVLTSWHGIGSDVVRAARSLRPVPQLWVLSGYDEDALLAQGVFFRADRVFEKPFQSMRVARELRGFLDEIGCCRG